MHTTADDIRVSTLLLQRIVGLTIGVGGANIAGFEYDPLLDFRALIGNFSSTVG